MSNKIHGPMLLVAGFTLAIGMAAEAARAEDPFAGLASHSLTEIQMDEMRGGDEAVDSFNKTAEAMNTVTATNSGSIGGESSAGELSVGGDAFGNFGGMNTFVMNTGNLNNLTATASLSVVMTE